jgi:hypothetical protein
LKSILKWIKSGWTGVSPYCLCWLQRCTWSMRWNTRHWSRFAAKVPQTTHANRFDSNADKERTNSIWLGLPGLIAKMYLVNALKHKALISISVYFQYLVGDCKDGLGRIVFLYNTVGYIVFSKNIPWLQRRTLWRFKKNQLGWWQP